MLDDLRASLTEDEAKSKVKRILENDLKNYKFHYYL